MAKILITGANSFVGTNFQKFSRFRDIDEISLIDHKPEEINFGKYDVVLHLAAIVHQSNKISEKDYLTINRDLCLKVADHAKKAGVKQFVFLSTIKVYGNSGHDLKILNEHSGCFPDDPYGRSKLEAEIGLKKMETPQFIISIIRTPLVYGEGVKANMMSLIKLIEKIQILPFKNIVNKRNFTYTENLVGFIDQIIFKKASGVFIAMDENAISTTELINFISKYLGRNVTLFKLPQIFSTLGVHVIPGVFDRLYSSLEFDNNKTLRELDYKPPFSTEEGIKKMVLAYMNRDPRFT